MNTTNVSQSTYIRPIIYDIYNNISLIFCVVPDSVSLAAKLHIIITTVELCMCVRVCMTFNFILIFYHCSAFYHVMPGMILSKTVASCTTFRDDVSAFMA